MNAVPSILADLTSPLRLEYLSIPGAALLFVALALPVIWLGMRSLNWLGTTRKWVAISLRLSVIWVLVLLICGAQWIRQNRDLEVIVLRDVSTSTNSVVPPRGKTLMRAVDDAIESDSHSKRGGDTIGVVGFSRDAQIEALPDNRLHLDSRPLQAGGDGTDIASAMRLGLASFRPDAMHRLVLVSDGNATQGDTDGAVCTAASMGIPIDVLPLHYAIRRDVLLDRMIAPAWERQGEPFGLDLILRSTSVAPVGGTLSITENGQPLETSHVELRAGATSFHCKVPAQSHPGLAQFRATFQANRAFDDALPGNNSAEAFTFIRGKSQILYVNGEPASADGSLPRALQSNGIELSQITPCDFPSRLIDLEPFDAIILSNVSRGPGGLSLDQDKLLAHYVCDLGGGLMMIGGPETLGPGNWHGSALEKVLPVDCDIPAERITPAGAIVLVLDHSGSMTEPMPNSSDLTKQQVASDSAILALKTLQRDDMVGVIGFASSPEWVVKLAPNSDPELSARKILAIKPTEGTNICPAMEEACIALEKLNPEDAGIKRIVLLTDGVSDGGDYDGVLARLRAANITLSTIAVGGDADLRLLRHLADRGGGAMYAVDSASQLKQVFVREARTLRRQLIHEPTGGIDLVQSLDGIAMLKLNGMVLTSRKPNATIDVPIFTADYHHDPILASWNVGLGRATVFTSDATTRWAPQWVASPGFAKFWADQIRGVSRPPMSGEFDIRMTRDGATTRLIVEAIGDTGAAKSFIRFTGRLAGPEDVSADIDLQQTGPGRYETTLSTPVAGNYAALIQYHDPAAVSGSLLAGISVPASVELRDMQSNEAYLADIAARTGGRVLPPLDIAGSAGLFDREGLSPSISAHPINDLLICILMGMLVTDVAVRRIHWDWVAVKHWAFVGIAAVQGFTTTRKIDARPTLAALRKVHQDAWRGGAPPRANQN
jgi:Mg-chelatase subunit ChlD